MSTMRAAARQEGRAAVRGTYVPWDMFFGERASGGQGAGQKQVLLSQAMPSGQVAPFEQSRMQALSPLSVAICLHTLLAVPVAGASKQSQSFSQLTSEQVEAPSRPAALRQVMKP